MNEESPNRPASRPSCLLVILLPLLAVFCIGVVFGINTISELPERAERSFGPPTPRLGTLERYLLSARLLSAEEWLKTPVDSLSSPQLFSVEFGESASSVVQNLSNASLIDNTVAFSLYLQYGGKDKTIQAGEYIFSRAMTPIQIAEGLQDATPTEVTFRVLSGWRMEEIAESLPTSGLEITPNQFLIAARNNPQQYSVGKHIPEGASLEGFFVPGKYTITRDESTNGLIQTLVEGFEGQIDQDLLDAFSQRGLTVFDAITLAAIIEREAVAIEEAPLIASVYLNRLAIGIKLDADPTVQYALGYNRSKQSWWTNPLSLRDLELNSPFNTYIYAGLPPGPIANPSRQAIQAVAFPAESSYYYFRAACDGSGFHNFSSTFEEHLSHGCEGES